jgi:hypothetical protein
MITQICSTDDDLPLDWTVRHGRSSALSVALKEASPQVYTDDYKDKICRVLLAYLTGDRVCLCLCVRVCTCVRACACVRVSICFYVYGKSVQCSVILR